MQEMRAGDCDLPTYLTSRVNHTATGLPSGEQREGYFLPGPLPQRQPSGWPLPGAWLLAASSVQPLPLRFLIRALLPPCTYPV